MNRGFSLVELSIVLVILGLLTGGILAGQSLIRASELRAVSTEYQRYVAAAHTFRDKYFAIPGDFRDATKFWNLQVVGSGCTSNSGLSTAGSPGACDGNGNGTLNPAGAVSQSGDFFQFWRHLQLAGLVEGTYSGLAGPNDAAEHVLGTNSPRSKLGNGGWGVYNHNSSTPYGDAATFTYQYGNHMGFGAYHASSWPLRSVLKPEELWNIDMKMDDGKPGTGKVLARDGYGFTVSGGCTLASGPTNYAADYNLASSNVACAMMIPNAF